MAEAASDWIDVEKLFPGMRDPPGSKWILALRRPLLPCKSRSEEALSHSRGRDVMILSVAFSAARSEGVRDEDPLSSMESSLSSQDRHSAGQAGGA